MGDITSMKKFLSILCKIFIAFVVISIMGFLFVFHSPYTKLKDLWVTTAMTTYSHQYLAKWFVSEEEIAEIMKRNKVLDPKEEINLDLINTQPQPLKTEKTEFIKTEETVTPIKEETFEEEPEETIEDEEEVDPIKLKQAIYSDKTPYYMDDKLEIYDISGLNYKGKVMIIYDPSTVFLGVTKYLGEKGEWVMEMSKNYNAVAGINAGGFDDPNWMGSGGDPVGLTISENQLIVKSGGKYHRIDIESDDIFKYYKRDEKFNLIGFNDENKLILGKYTMEKIKEMKIRDAVSFSPILILNGVPTEMTGNGGWGIAPRTGIGQRADGAVIFLTIDGRQPTWSIGAGVKDMRDIFIEFQAVNAVNLDGGTSTTMTLNHEMINKSCSKYGGRKIATSWLVR